ncbi:ER degradation enhancer, mannosidase alpha-like 1, partial [Phenoliferia sp. Uapishka_3]
MRSWSLLQAPAALVVLVLLAVAPNDSAAFMSSDRKRELAGLARDTWLHAYKSYKRVAFPSDEVLPLSCKAQGHDRENPENVGVNDVMGDYALTLVDSLDAFAILGDREGFENGVREVIQWVDFDKDSRVQVFEVTIRVLGGLLSGHMLATNPKRGYELRWYRGELLALARDLGRRLLPAFNTPTGIPFPRVHLQHGLSSFLLLSQRLSFIPELSGVRKGETTETCAAGAGSLLLEFGALSRLTGDPVFEEVARKAFFAMWNRRSDLDLLGNTIDLREGKWLHGVSSTGAGIDSFFEYAAKAYVLFGEDEWWRVWDESYSAIMRHIRAPDGFWYRGANMHTGQLASVLVDSLSAFFPGVQTLVGDLESAIKAHAVYAFQWKRYAGLPEVFDINRRVAVSLGYPLRPEFIESNLYLYQATKDEFYLEIAEQVLHDINNRTRVECGLAAIQDLTTGALEDKQPSFVTAETLKYLFLTFDVDNPFNHDDTNMVYSTEGHMLELKSRPVPGRRRRTMPPEALSCLAYDPTRTDRHQHPLSLSVARRTDFEHARYLAGYQVEDEAKEVAEGRWSEDGICEIPTSEEYNVELLFASSTDTEDVAPSTQKVRQERDGSVHISGISGLRFSLTRAWPGGHDGFLVSRVAQYRVPVGSAVVISDPVVLSSIPPPRLEKVHLRIALKTEGEKDNILVVPALAANFGPSISGSAAAKGSFALSQPALPLRSHKSGFPYGCGPHVDVEVTPALLWGEGVSRNSLDGQVLILRRGRCSFARKAHFAALAGAKAVVVVNNTPSDEEDSMIVPSVDGEDKELKALVPLLLISNTTGTTLEEALSGEVEALIRPVEPTENSIQPLMLGGYSVGNVILQRK